MNTPLGTEVDLSTGHIVLDVVPTVRERGTAAPPLFSPTFIVATVAHLSYCYCWAILYVHALYLQTTRHIQIIDVIIYNDIFVQHRQHAVLADSGRVIMLLFQRPWLKVQLLSSI